MRTREKNFVDVEKLRTIYSFQIKWKGKWVFPGKNGEIQKFETREACDQARQLYRQRKDLLPGTTQEPQ